MLKWRINREQKIDYTNQMKIRSWGDYYIIPWQRLRLKYLLQEFPWMHNCRVIKGEIVSRWQHCTPHVLLCPMFYSCNVSHL